MIEEIIKTIDLAIGYQKGMPILDDINVSLKKNQIVCLMGTNGIGKSTLLRALAGIELPLSGQIQIDGKNINAFSRPDLARKIAIVLTDRTMSSNLSVRELVSFGRFPYTNWLATINQKDQEIIDTAIELVGIEDLLNKKIYEISDGQLQKSMIARALAQNSDIIILDEPNVHLDLNNRVEVMSLLKNLSKNEGNLC